MLFVITEPASVQQVDVVGRTSLMYAVHFGHIKCLSNLLNSKIDINFQAHGKHFYCFYCTHTCTYNCTHIPECLLPCLQFPRRGSFCSDMSHEEKVGKLLSSHRACHMTLIVRSPNIQEKTCKVD